MRRARLWFLSAVVIGLLPVLYGVIHNAIFGEKQNWHAAFASGDALVLSAALAGGCVYDLLIKKVKNEAEDTKAVLIISALIIAAVAALWFGEMRDNPADASRTALWTVAYLGLTIIVCFRSLYLTYDSEEARHSHPSTERSHTEERSLNDSQVDESQLATQGEGGGPGA